MSWPPRPSGRVWPHRVVGDSRGPRCSPALRGERQRDSATLPGGKFDGSRRVGANRGAVRGAGAGCALETTSREQMPHWAVCLTPTILGGFIHAAGRGVSHRQTKAREQVITRACCDDWTPTRTREDTTTGFVRHAGDAQRSSRGRHPVRRRYLRSRRSVGPRSIPSRRQSGSPLAAGR